MQSISLPKKPKYTQIDESSGRFVIEGCYPGYGTTLGNALRRVLLSSLEGAAITSVKIKGVSHEFSTMDGVLEDVIQIILNLKQVRIKMDSDEPVKITLKAKGEKSVTAANIECPGGVEVVNTDQAIATLTKKDAEIEMEMDVERGIGYIPVDQQEEGEKEIGVIAIDSIYTPVKRVNYEVENMRVGKRTDYDRITLDITTDGTSTPEEVFYKASKILVDQFSAILSLETSEEKEEVAEKDVVKEAEAEEIEEKEEDVDPKNMEISDVKGISTRTINALESNKLTKVSDVIKMTEEELIELEGMGEKGVKEVRKAVGIYGLTLKK
jgi:DNA-directed RNA polymerase subunit alpha